MVPSERSPSPESLLAGWLARVEAGENPPFEELVREHAEHAAQLRELHRHWQALRGVLGEHGGSLAERLRGRFGSDVDPQVTLSIAAEPPTASDSTTFSSAVLSRLAGRGPTSSRYRLEGEIAHGGMGAVLRVLDEDLRRHLAMKVMLGKSAAAGQAPQVDPRQLSRFLEEAQITSQLDHPGIVPVHDLGLDAGGHVYFTMKLVKGKTLKDVFAEMARGEGPWTQVHVLGLLLKVCEAMSYAHAKGVIHRDLKPANVMVGRYGEVFVMDWGLAKVLGRADEKDVRIRDDERKHDTSAVMSVRTDRDDETQASPLYTMDGDVVGTPAYMPPEQAAGRVEEIGPASDVYALGAMLYHLIAGHMPYLPPESKVANNYTVWQLVQKGSPQPLHEVAPDTPAELVAICEKAMARRAEDRYPDTAALAADLSAYVEGRVVHAYEAGALAEAKKWVRRNRPLAAALAGAVALLVLAVGAVAYVEADGRRAAEKQRQVALLQGQKAKEQERIATARADDVLRLSALQDLEDVIRDADALWPPHPEKIPAFEAWIARAEALEAELPRHQTKREELRALALPRSEEQRQAERESHPEFARVAALSGEIEARRRALVQRRDGATSALPEPDWSTYPEDPSALNALAWPMIEPQRTAFGEEPLGLALALRALDLAERDPDLAATIGDTVAWGYAALGRDAEAAQASRAALESASEPRKTEFEGYLARIEAHAAERRNTEGLRMEAATLERLAGELVDLEARVDERRDWRFPEEYGEARWWDAQLTKLILGLESLESGLLARDTTTLDHGWSVRKRLTFARELDSGFAEGGAHRRAWERDLPAIRAAYPGLEIGPQMGLVPIGADPLSGLWEFAHLMTGKPPERGPNGRLQVTEDASLVLVLIPGGRFWMGAQSDNPAAQNYDPNAQRYEAPVHEVQLSAYFLSKYEMTQAQWLRLTGKNPSYYQLTPLAATLLHPVELVSWLDCVQWLGRAGLALPTEAQWERAARGGTDTPWWTGAERESLLGAANLADQSAARANAVWQAIKDWPDLDDGYAVHAPVGTYLANPFGLHEVHGNLWEWCLDGFDFTYYTRSPALEPVAPAVGSGSRVTRGGGFALAASQCRASHRGADAPTYAEGSLGTRPARAVE